MLMSGASDNDTRSSFPSTADQMSAQSFDCVLDQKRPVTAHDGGFCAVLPELDDHPTEELCLTIGAKNRIGGDLNRRNVRLDIGMLEDAKHVAETRRVAHAVDCAVRPDFQRNTTQIPARARR